MDDLAFVGGNVGIQEVSSYFNKVSVYPNPTVNELFVSIPNKSSEYKISVYNIFGEKTIETILTDNKSKINLSPYSNGMYFYQVSDLNNNMFDKGKFIVNK